MTVPQVESARMDFERESERAGLERSLVEAKRSRGALALIEGPAGLGKTRLLELAREQAEADGMVVLAARGAEPERREVSRVKSGRWS